MNPVQIRVNQQGMAPRGAIPGVPQAGAQQPIPNAAPVNPEAVAKQDRLSRFKCIAISLNVAGAILGALAILIFILPIMSHMNKLDKEDGSKKIIHEIRWEDFRDDHMWNNITGPITNPNYEGPTCKADDIDREKTLKILDAKVDMLNQFWDAWTEKKCKDKTASVHEYFKYSMTYYILQSVVYVLMALVAILRLTFPKCLGCCCREHNRFKFIMITHLMRNGLLYHFTQKEGMPHRVFLTNFLVYVSIGLPIYFFIVFGWKGPAEEKEVAQLQQIVVHHHHAIAHVEAAVHHEEEAEQCDDDTFFRQKLQKLAASLNVHHLEKINGLKMFITKLWERNQSLPIIIKTSTRGLFWKKHEATMKNRLLQG